MFEITYRYAIVTNCDYIGRTISGVQAVVTKGGAEVFRSRPSVKRICPKLEAQAFIAAQAA